MGRMEELAWMSLPALMLLAVLLLWGQALDAGGGETRFEGKIYVVAVDGDDENPGTPEKPWRTIQHAVDEMQPGDTVGVREGVYPDPVVVEKSGAPDRYITIENYPGEHPVIDPEFEVGCAVRIAANYIRFRGFEIRNCKPQPDRRGDSGALTILSANHCLAERNTIHHIIGSQPENGRGRTSTGIYLQDSDDITVQNNTVYDIVGHSECKGILTDTVSNVTIRRNLAYLCDKEGIRLVTYDRDSNNVVEGNIALSNNIGIAINMCFVHDHTDTVRSNFAGWNCSHGMQIKHTINTLVTHNTAYGNQYAGLRFNDRPFNYYAVVKNNILSNNVPAWSIVDRENFSEHVDYDFYQYRPGSLVAWFDWSEADACYSLADIRKKTAATPTIGTTYEVHGREGDPLFVNPGKRDFRLRGGSPAKGAADDGGDMGALEGELSLVGADMAYGLAHIPDLGELELRVESFSSESEQGRAANAVDQTYGTYWEVDAAKDSERQIVLGLPGDEAHELTFITLTKAESPDNYYRQFRLSVDDGSGRWNLIPEPPEHPFVGYTSRPGINNGETWALPAGTMARRLKIELVSGYGSIIQLPEVRVYAGPGAGRSPR